jgi:hypothetical protein
MRNLVIDEMAAHLGDFKPSHVADCFSSSTYRLFTASSMPFGEEPTSSIFCRCGLGKEGSPQKSTLPYEAENLPPRRLFFPEIGSSDHLE